MKFLGYVLVYLKIEFIKLEDFYFETDIRLKFQSIYNISVDKKVDFVRIFRLNFRGRLLVCIILMWLKKLNQKLKICENKIGIRVF